MEKTLSYCKMILLSVCPCIAVVPELADDTTDALGAHVLELHEDVGRFGGDSKLELGNAECKHRITR